MSTVQEHQSLNTLTARAFREVLPGLGDRYALRPEQYRYAMHVAESIMLAPFVPDRADVCLLEGGTGTGKTLGYLIPACLHAALTDERIGISTHTLALQDQLFGREALLTGRQPDFQAGDVSDLAVAIEIVRRMTGVTLKAAFRKGRQIYFSPEAALKKVHEQRDAKVAEDPDKAERLDALETWALHVLDVARKAGYGTEDSPAESTEAAEDGGIDEILAADPHQGMISSWIDDGNWLPEGITAGEISLADESDDRANPWYREHAARTIDARIVVFSHAMRLIDVSSPRDLLPEFGIVIHDEADMLGDVAEGWTRKRFRPITLWRAMKDARPVFTSIFEKDEVFKAQWDTLFQSLDESRNDLRAMRPEASPRELFLAWGSPRAERLGTQYKGIRAQIRNLYNRIGDIDTNSLTRGLRGQSSAKRRKGIIADLKASLDALDRILPRLGKFAPPLQEGKGLEGEDAAKRKSDADHIWGGVAISWSPKVELASIETIDLFPGRVFGKQWRIPSKTSKTRLVILTSATLRVPTTNRSDEWVFMRTVVGIPRDQVGYVEEPENFGEIHRIVQVSGVPAPFVKKNKKNDADGKDSGEADVAALTEPEQEYEPRWLDLAGAALKMLADEVERAKGAALVHAASFRDVRILAERIQGDPRFWLHTRALDKECGILALQNGEASVLVTPSLHAGANIRALDGGQLLTHIVVLRLPMAPTDQTMLAALERNLAARGHEDPRKEAESRVFRISENRAIHRLTQQIGRGIRAGGDRIEVWVLDPRFPLGEVIDARLTGKIPAHACRSFSRTWHQAFPHRFLSVLRAPNTVRVIVPNEDGEGGFVMSSPGRHGLKL